jgi:hypothetical protein
MHIAHHVSAARYANWHLGLGAAATALAAIVGASIFATLTKSPRTRDQLPLSAWGWSACCPQR